MARTIRYYAFAINPAGKIEQLLVTKEPGKPTRQKWTGKVYKTNKAAYVDMAKLNTIPNLTKEGLI